MAGETWKSHKITSRDRDNDRDTREQTEDYWATKDPRHPELRALPLYGSR